MARSTLILFEDAAAGHFEPLALTRSVARLRLGRWTHRERWRRRCPDRSLGLLVRGYLSELEAADGGWAFVNEAPPEGDTLFVAAALADPLEDFGKAVRELEPGRALLADGRLLAARATGGTASRLATILRELAGEGPFPASSRPDWPALLSDLGITPEDAAVVPLRTPVDLMALNGAAIDADFASVESELPPPDPAAHPGVQFLAPERIRMDEGVRLDPGVVLDAREGTIHLGPRTRVMANSLITGPVTVGSDCTIRALSRVTDGVSLGPHSRIGGEVASTIVLGFSNKQHDGFVGHSVLGSWVNLGAATDTSDLKNDYGNVRIVLAGETLDTGSRHVGSLIGDHSKTGIHTMLNTGTVVGVSSNVFGAGFTPKEIPSFVWGGGSDWREYRMKKALQVAKVVTSRRGVEFRPLDEEVLTRVREATAGRRRAMLEA
jgi:UDP-N-acetylglucosamine diphosphorylase/glucosamine-1-phosphate N-acetyltransferase